MPTAMYDPTPDWLKPENASVLDSQLVKILRAIVNANPWPKPLQGVLPNPNPAAMVADPQAQVLGLMGADVPGGGPRIEGWHASPHDFDKFDFSKIGTGEGAQAFGHGGYIAQRHGTAKYYWENFAGRGGDFSLFNVEGGGKVPAWLRDTIQTDPTVGARTVDNLLAEFQERLPRLKALALHSEEARQSHQTNQIEPLEALIEGLKNVKAGKAIKPPARMYQVAIHADPEHLLDWDKPLAEQSPHVQQALQQLGVSPKPVQPWHAHQITAEDVAKKLVPANYAPGSWISVVRDPAGQIEWHGGQLFGSEAAAAENAAARTAVDQRALRDKGRELYQDLGAPTKKAASQKLNDAGIPGIKYLDQMSRGKDEGGSYNYVVFDDAKLEILKKLGLLLPAIGAGSQTYGSMFDQSQAVGK